MYRLKRHNRNLITAGFLMGALMGGMMNMIPESFREGRSSNLSIPTEHLLTFSSSEVSHCISTNIISVVDCGS